MYGQYSYYVLKSIENKKKLKSLSHNVGLHGQYREYVIRLYDIYENFYNEQRNNINQSHILLRGHQREIAMTICIIIGIMRKNGTTYSMSNHYNDIYGLLKEKHGLDNNLYKFVEYLRLNDIDTYNHIIDDRYELIKKRTDLVKLINFKNNLIYYLSHSTL